MPLLTISDTFGTHMSTPGAPRMPRAARNTGTEMSLRAFHLLFIALSVVLAAFFAAWAVGQYRLEHQTWLRRHAGVLALASGGGLAVYGTRFQRKTRNL